MSLIATCTAEMWTFNSKAQSPCVVATALERVCNPTAAISMVPLRVNYHYPGPRKSTETPCICSSVYYSLVCACAACQTRRALKWTPFTENCSSVNTGRFPQSLPQGYPVPHWAYQDVVGQDGWSRTNAQLDKGPEESAPPPPTPTTTPVDASTSTPVSSSTTSTSSQTTTSSPAGSSAKKSDTGVIVGGVVGGVVALALIGAFVFIFLTRRKHQRDKASTQLPASPTSMTQNNQPSLFGSNPQHTGGNNNMSSFQTHNTSPTYFQQSFKQQPGYMSPAIPGQGQHEGSNTPIHNTNP